MYIVGHCTLSGAEFKLSNVQSAMANTQNTGNNAVLDGCSTEGYKWVDWLRIVLYGIQVACRIEHLMMLIITRMILVVPERCLFKV